MKKSCVAACPVEWLDGRGISGRMRVEWVAGSAWNRWSDAHGMGGQMTVESAHFMADSVKYHTDNLEKEVAARTADLERANLELAKRSNTDGLTGVANRRYFDEILAQEVERARRHKQALALIMLDVDQFKKYNDHYGHLAGDNCLVQIATELKNNTRRPTDLPARYGGEEFVIIAAQSETKDALALAEILRIRIEQLAIEHALSASGVVTASFGVAVLVPDESNGAEDLIRMADKALYLAKEKGRNRVEYAPEETLFT